MRGMTGPPADAFIATYTSETAGLSASGNLYCASAIDAVRFGIDEVPVNFAAWTAAVGTDTGSTVSAASDASCTSW